MQTQKSGHHCLYKVMGSCDGMAYLIRGLVCALCGAAEAQQGCCDGADGDSHVHPRQEGSLIGKEGLGLYPHGSRPAWGFTCRVWGFTVRLWGFRVQVWGLTVRVWGFTVLVRGFTVLVWGFAVRLWGLPFRVCIQSVGIHSERESPCVGTQRENGICPVCIFQCNNVVMVIVT